MTQTTPPQEQGTHFWHMSFLARNEIGMTAQSRTGHYTPEPGITRFDAFEKIHRQVIDASPYLADAAMLAFDIQPNQI